MEIHIARRISAFLHSITVGGDVISFAESTLGICGIDEIARCISLHDTCDEGIVDIIFSPDDKLQSMLEPHLPCEGLSVGNEENIAALVLHEIDRAVISFPGSTLTAEIPLTDTLIRHFIGKLNLRTKLPFGGTGDFPACLSDTVIAAIRVKIRNGRYQTTIERERTIISVVDGLGRLTGGTDSSLMLDCIDYLLELYRANSPDRDISTIFSAARRYCIEVIDQSAIFNDHLKRYGMEFLMANKIQPPVAAIDEIRRKAVLLDLIISAVGSSADSAPAELTVRFDIHRGGAMNEGSG